MKALAWLALLAACLLATPAAAHADPLDPAEAPVSVRRAVFRAEKAATAGDLEEASRILSNALTGGGDRDHPAIHFRLGVYLLELERPDEALVELRAASKQAPESALVWRELARAAYETGGYAEAADAFEQAYRRQLDEHAGHDDHGDDDHAPDEPEPELLYYAGIAWILAEQPDRGTDVLAGLIQDHPDPVPLDWTRALISAAASAGTPDRAEAGVERLLRERPDDPESWQLASQLSQLADDVPQAATRLQVAAWLTELSPTDQRRLAELQAAAGAPRQAARVYAGLWDDGRGDRSVAEPLAVTWLQAHEPDSARVVLTAHLASEPSARLWMLLGDLEYGVDRWQAAADAYARATDLEPDRGRGWLMQGAAEVRLDRRDAAVAHLRRALEDPTVADQARRLLDQIEAAGS
jgi:predicted Zn-dependent protease